MKIKTLAIILGLLVLAGAVLVVLTRDNPDDTDAVSKVTPSGSPFGSGENINIPALAENTVTPIEMESFDDVTSEKELFRLSDRPVAGFIPLNIKGDLVVRYTDRATGHIVDVSLNTGEERRVTNTTLPKIYEAYFRSDGLAVLLRSLANDTDSVKNLSLTLTAPIASSTEALYGVSAANLRGDIDSVVVSGSSLNYVLRNNTAIASSNFSGTDIKTIFSLPFSGWRLSRIGSDLLIYPKAHSQSAGIAYRLKGGAMEKLVGPLNGLTAIANSNGSRILYSYNENGVIKQAVKTISNGAIKEISPASLAEKCVWSLRNNAIFFCGAPIEGTPSSEPENWYLGRTHFTDYLWSFDTESDTAQLLIEPKTDFGLDMDIYEPKLTPNEDFLIFINKQDLTLWAIRLN